METTYKMFMNQRSNTGFGCQTWSVASIIHMDARYAESRSRSLYTRRVHHGHQCSLRRQDKGAPPRRQAPQAFMILDSLDLFQGCLKGRTVLVQDLVRRRGAARQQEEHAGGPTLDLCS